VGVVIGLTGAPGVGAGLSGAPPPDDGAAVDGEVGTAGALGLEGDVDTGC